MSDAVATLGINIKAYEAGLKKAQTQASRFADGFKGAIGGVGAIIGAGAVAGLVSMAKEAVETSERFKSIQQSIAAITGSMEVAALQMTKIRDLAAKTPLDFQGAAQGVANLQALGLTSKEAFDTLKELGNVAVLSGLGSGDLTEMLDALVTIKSNGTIIDSQLDKITKRSPLVSKALEETFGASTAAKLRELGVSADELIEKFPKMLASLDRADADTLTNAIEDLSMAWDEFMSQMGDEWGPTLIAIFKNSTTFVQGLSGSIEDLIDELASYYAWITSLGDVTLEEARKIQQEIRFAEEQLRASSRRNAEEKQAEIDKATVARRKEKAEISDSTEKIKEQTSALENQRKLIEQAQGKSWDKAQIEEELNIQELRLSGQNKEADARERALQIEREKLRVIQQGLANEEEAQAIAERSAALGDKLKQIDKDKSSSSFDEEIQLLQLQLAGQTKKEEQLRREIALRELTNKLIEDQGISEEEARKKAEQRLSLEDQLAKKKEGAGGGKIKGYSQEQRANNEFLKSPFERIDNKPSAWDQLQKSESAFDKLQKSPSAFDKLQQKKGGSPLGAKAQANAAPASSGDPSLTTLQNIEAKMDQFIKAVS